MDLRGTVESWTVEPSAKIPCRCKFYSISRLVKLSRYAPIMEGVSSGEEKSRRVVEEIDARGNE